MSNAKTREEEKLEWKLNDVYYEKEPETCLCGHFPIIEICTLFNGQNGSTAIVGNCCVKKFIGLPSDKIFEAVRRVRQDYKKALNGETINHAHEQGWISDWECDFYFDTMRKRNLSQQQTDKKVKINQKVVAKIVTTRPKLS